MKDEFNKRSRSQLYKTLKRSDHRPDQSVDLIWYRKEFQSRLTRVRVLVGTLHCTVYCVCECLGHDQLSLR
jgi:hypothetical protein